MPDITNRRTNGLFDLKTFLKFENTLVVIVFESFLFTATSFTKNIKMITATAPGIRDTRNIPRISIT